MSKQRNFEPSQDIIITPNNNRPILPLLAHLKLKGFAETTLRGFAQDLAFLVKNCNLENIKKTKQFIMFREVKNTTKNKYLNIYSHYLDYYKIPHEEFPYLKTTEANIRVPLTKEIDALINGARYPLSLKLMVAKECGLRPIENANLYVKMIDLEARKIYPETAKYGSRRVLKISHKLCDLLRLYISETKRQPHEKLWKTSQKNLRESYMRYRNRIAKKLAMPSLLTIRLYDFRHYYGTMLYRRIRNLIIVQQKMGHKSILSTMKYMHIVDEEDGDEFETATATTLKEFRNLIENGFELVGEMEEVKVFKKRK